MEIVHLYKNKYKLIEENYNIIFNISNQKFYLNKCNEIIIAIKNIVEFILDTIELDPSYRTIFENNLIKIKKKLEKKLEKRPPILLDAPKVKFKKRVEKDLPKDLPKDSPKDSDQDQKEILKKILRQRLLRRRQNLAQEETFQATGTKIQHKPTVEDNSPKFSINRNDLNNQDKQKYDFLKKIGLNDLAIANKLNIPIPNEDKNKKNQRPSYSIKNLETPKKPETPKKSKALMEQLRIRLLKRNNIQQKKPEPQSQQKKPEPQSQQKKPEPSQQKKPEPQSQQKKPEPQSQQKKPEPLQQRNINTFLKNRAKSKPKQQQQQQQQGLWN